MRGEKKLGKVGFYTRLVAPPPEFREGCDLAIEIDIMEMPAIERKLGEEGIPFMKIIPLGNESTEPVDIVNVVRYADSVMVKAGNMKMTFDHSSGLILNVSGGGCPDVPYLYAIYVGENLQKARKPRDIGFTLCALMLDRAFEECLKIYAG